MSLSLIVFTQLFLKVAVSDAKSTSMKMELNVKFNAKLKVIQGHPF